MRLTSIIHNISLKTLYQSLNSIACMQVCDTITTHDSKMRHPLPCHISNDKISDMLFARHLASHYPFLRSVLKLSYNIMQANKHINKINKVTFLGRGIPQIVFTRKQEEWHQLYRTRRSVQQGR